MIQFIDFLYLLIFFLFIYYKILKKISLYYVLFCKEFVIILQSIEVCSLIYLDKLLIELNRSKTTKIIWRIFRRELKKSDYFFFSIKNNLYRTIFSSLKNKQGIKAVNGNRTKILNNYKKIIHMIIKDINDSSISVKMMFYIWKCGGKTNEINKALIRAAKRGIKCKILIDSFGSWSFIHSKDLKFLRKYGIEIVESLRIRFFYIFIRRIDLRNHKKIVVIDNKISYVGSMNMIDPNYYKKKSKFGRWIDLVLRIEGPASEILEIIYELEWKIETNDKNYQIKQLNKYVRKFKENSVIQVMSSSINGFPKNLIQKSIKMVIFSAKRQLILTTPYFVPSNNLIKTICNVSLKGIKVSLIVPKKNNSFLVHWSSRKFYHTLLESGVVIYQFYGGFLHTKSISVDDELFLVGSCNFDKRSLYINSEIILLVQNKKRCSDLIKLQKKYMKSSKIVEFSDWKKRSVLKKLIEKFCFFFSSFL
ncbi:hypothetical protein AOQ88_00995 [Candidatus Riesia sp. GBBU]|nr:hypothetical protein AOQ88_00995 [Candidatus Riesia sp. GBBU]